MEFDDYVAQLGALRDQAKADRFLALSHQLEAWIWYVQFRPRTYSSREIETYEGPVPSDEATS